MTVKIAGSTPEGDKNGLAAVVAVTTGRATERRIS